MDSGKVLKTQEDIESHVSAMNANLDRYLKERKDQYDARQATQLKDWVRMMCDLSVWTNQPVNLAEILQRAHGPRTPAVSSETAQGFLDKATLMVAADVLSMCDFYLKRWAQDAGQLDAQGKCEDLNLDNAALIGINMSSRFKGTKPSVDVRQDLNPNKETEEILYNISLWYKLCQWVQGEIGKGKSLDDQGFNKDIRYKIGIIKQMIVGKDRAYRSRPPESVTTETVPSASSSASVVDPASDQPVREQYQLHIDRDTVAKKVQEASNSSKSTTKWDLDWFEKNITAHFIDADASDNSKDMLAEIKYLYLVMIGLLDKGEDISRLQNFIKARVEELFEVHKQHPQWRGYDKSSLIPIRSLFCLMIGSVCRRSLGLTHGKNDAERLCQEYAGLGREMEGVSKDKLSTLKLYKSREYFEENILKIMDLCIFSKEGRARAEDKMEHQTAANARFAELYNDLKGKYEENQREGGVPKPLSWVYYLLSKEVNKDIGQSPARDPLTPENIDTVDRSADEHIHKASDPKLHMDVNEVRARIERARSVVDKDPRHPLHWFEKKVGVHFKSDNSNPMLAELTYIYLLIMDLSGNDSVQMYLCNTNLLSCISAVPDKNVREGYESDEDYLFASLRSVLYVMSARACGVYLDSNFTGARGSLITKGGLIGCNMSPDLDDLLRASIVKGNQADPVIDNKSLQEKWSKQVFSTYVYKKYDDFEVNIREVLSTCAGMFNRISAAGDTRGKKKARSQGTLSIDSLFLALDKRNKEYPRGSKISETLIPINQYIHGATQVVKAVNQIRGGLQTQGGSSVSGDPSEHSRKGDHGSARSSQFREPHEDAQTKRNNDALEALVREASTAATPTKDTDVKGTGSTAETHVKVTSVPPSTTTASTKAGPNTSTSNPHMKGKGPITTTATGTKFTGPITTTATGTKFTGPITTTAPGTMKEATDANPTKAAAAPTAPKIPVGVPANTGPQNQPFNDQTQAGNNQDKGKPNSRSFARSLAFIAVVVLIATVMIEIFCRRFTGQGLMQFIKRIPTLGQGITVEQLSEGVSNRRV